MKTVDCKMVAQRAQVQDDLAAADFERKTCSAVGEVSPRA